MGTIFEQTKITNTLTDNADQLKWYIGTYLSLPRVFMSIVKHKIVYSPKVESVLIPIYTVQDPVTNKKININITDRYFFIGSNDDIYSETDICAGQHMSTIMLLRNGDDAYNPSQVTAADIRNVIRTHIQKRRITIQQDVTIYVTDGTFSGWYGTVEQKSEDKENIRVRFMFDNYSYITDMPAILCKTAT